MKSLLGVLTLITPLVGCVSQRTLPLPGYANISGYQFGFHNYAFGKAIGDLPEPKSQRFVGEGCSRSVLSLVAWGDSSIGQWQRANNNVTTAEAEVLSVALVVPLYTQLCIKAYSASSPSNNSAKR